MILDYIELHSEQIEFKRFRFIKVAVQLLYSVDFITVHHFGESLKIAVKCGLSTV